MSLTNVHVMWNPLRSAGRALFDTIQNGLVFIGESNVKKSALRLNEYKEQSRQRLAWMSSNNDSAEDEITGPDPNYKLK